MTPDSVVQFLASWGYPAYVVAFLATSCGSPVTEDLLLLAGGYLVSAGIFSWHVLLPLAYASVLVTDSIVFSFGRVLRTHSLRRGAWIRRVVRPAQLRLATRWFGRFGDWIVAVGRLVPGTRMIVFATAGARGMPLSRFLFIDGVASLVYVPVTLVIGAKLGERIGNLNRTLSWIGDRAFWIVLGLVAVVAIRHIWRRKVGRYLESTLDARR